MTFEAKACLYLACDFCELPPKRKQETETFWADNGHEAFQMAAKAGWRTFNDRHRAKCPHCVKAGKTTVIVRKP